MDKLELVEPDMMYEDGFNFFFEDYKNSGEEFVPFVLKYYTNTFSEYLSLLKGFPRGIGVPDKFVEHSTYWLKNENNQIMGVINIRHRLNEISRVEGGHIGYGVAPVFRRKGYAIKMLKAGLIKAKQLGVDRALLTCDKDNIASRKVITKNNGILDTEEEIDGRMIQRYWIKT